MRGTISAAVATLVLLLALPQAQAPATRLTRLIRDAGRPGPAALGIQSAPRPTAGATPEQPAEPPGSPQPTATAGVIDPADLAALRAVPRVIVIDPGHGGRDTGVRGRGGATEKAIALEAARRLRALLEARIGARVVLTRDDDSDVGFDARTAIANGSRPDLFVSLHLNASPSSDASGAVVYSPRLGREGEQVRQEAARSTLRAPAAGGATRTVHILPWELSQAPHVDRSARLATRLAEGLGSDASLRPAVVRQAPLHVLAGVNAPAALVELAYLTNPTQGSRAASDEFGAIAAEALLNGIVLFLRQPADAAAR